MASDLDLRFIPIASLDQLTSFEDQIAIRGEVALVWPYSKSTKFIALLIAEPDIRLRRQKGQVRVQIYGSSAEAVAATGLGIGDTVVLSLAGARWKEISSELRSPGRTVGGELEFGRRLSIRIAKDGQRISNIEIDEPRTPTAADFPETPIRHNSGLAAVTEPRLPTSPINWSSPFHIRAPKTVGRPLQPPSLINEFELDDGSKPGLGRKRFKYDRNSGGRWRLEGAKDISDDVEFAPSADGIPTQAPARHEPSLETSTKAPERKLQVFSQIPNAVTTFSNQLELTQDIPASPFVQEEPTTVMGPPALPSLVTSFPTASTDFALPTTPSRPSQRDYFSSQDVKAPKSPRLEPLESPGLPLVSPFPGTPIAGRQPSSSVRFAAVPLPTDFTPTLGSPIVSRHAHYNNRRPQASVAQSGTATASQEAAAESHESNLLTEPDPHQVNQLPIDDSTLRAGRTLGNTPNTIDLTMSPVGAVSNSFANVTQPLVEPDNVSQQQKDTQDLNMESVVMTQSSAGKEPFTSAIEGFASQDFGDPFASSVFHTEQQYEPINFESAFPLSQFEAPDLPREDQQTLQTLVPQDKQLEPSASRSFTGENSVDHSQASMSLQTKATAGFGDSSRWDMSQTQQTELMADSNTQGLSESQHALEKDFDFNAYIEGSGAQFGLQSYRAAEPDSIDDGEKESKLPKIAIQVDNPIVLTDESQDELAPSEILENASRIAVAKLEQQPNSAEESVPSLGAAVEAKIETESEVLQEEANTSKDTTEPVTVGPTKGRKKKAKASKSKLKRASEVPAALKGWFRSRNTPKKPEQAADDVKAVDENLLDKPTPKMINLPVADNTKLSSTPASPMASQSPKRLSGLRTALSYYAPLSTLQSYLNSTSSVAPNTVDVFGVVTSPTSKPAKANSGPKDFSVILHVQDQSSQPLQVHCFRPRKKALPEASVGDVILLREFHVKSRNRTLYLLSGSDSAWCVWRLSRLGEGLSKLGSMTGKELSQVEECNGPPVEVGREEYQHVVDLRKWYDDIENPQSVAAGSP